MKNYQDCGEAVLQAFRCLDIDYVMSSPGSEWGPVWEAFARQAVNKTKGPEYISCAHETLAVDLAIGYTMYTGRMQGVMLHTGVGLLQGSMGIDAAQRLGVPMLVVSGESLSYGERDGFDPGFQWQSSLSVVGGTHRLAEPLVKWANQATSPHTIFQQLVSAGEMAQRTPSGPTYMAVPIETMMHEWTPPASLRMAPPAPQLEASTADVGRVAELLCKAKLPAIITEAAGRTPEGYDALKELAELLAIPVVESGGADYTNFSQTHDLYMGSGRPEHIDEADVVLLVAARAPWYPARNRPKNATVIAVDETPFRSWMVYHNTPADVFLEGSVALSLSKLAAAVRAGKIDTAAVNARRARFAEAHRKMEEANRAAVAKVADKSPMAPMTLVASIADNMPANAIYVDETITHRGFNLRYLPRRDPRSYFHAAGGLGQGLGVALGVKLAAKDRPVVTVIGDGSFMYNPVIQSLALSHHRALPILVVIYNNGGYSAMRREHWQYYPDGVAAAKDIYVGHAVTDFDYSELVKPFGGYGRTVDNAKDLPAAFKDALKSVNGGKSAIVNVKLDGGAPEPGARH